MNLNTSFLLKSNKLFCHLFSRTLHTTTYCSKRKYVVDDNDRFEKTLSKLVKKNSFLPDEVLPFNPLHTYNEKKLQNAGKKQLHKRIIVREKMLSEVLLRQLQETVDSGQIEGLDDLHVTFKSVTMNGKNSCFVTWKTQGLATDLHIKQSLQSQSAHIRHVIIHSHVLGIIPKFLFCIDPGVVNEEEVYHALHSGNLDMGPTEDDTLEMVEDGLDEEKLVEGIEIRPNNSTFELFQVDNEALKDKIYAQIAKTKNDSVTNVTDEQSNAESSKEDISQNVGLFER